jgi:signal peptidase
MNLSLIRLVRRAVGSIGTALFVILVGFSLFTHLAPVTGHELFTITGGSMEPSIPVGSLVIATPVDASTVAVGDVVTIRDDNGTFVTHRVSRVVDTAVERSFQMKGDANESPDGGLVPARAIVGAADLFVPYAGYARAFLSTLTGLIATFAFLIALVLVYLLLGMLEPPTREASTEARRLGGS